MAGTLFVVCVPTREHEESILDLGDAKEGPSASSKQQLQNDHLDVGLLGSRSKSEDSLFAKDLQDDGSGSSRREMFIGPWRVDATDLPRTPRSPRNPRSRSPLVNAASMSRSDPEGLSARPPATTPIRRRRCHRFLETELENVLSKLNIHNAVWCMGRNNKYYQVLFSVESGNPCEEALQKLAETGIGVLMESVVSVLPCVLYYQGCEKSGAGSMDDLNADESAKKDDDRCPGHTGGLGGRGRGEQGGTWERFVQSVRARLTVAQVVEGVRANATFTFDFLLLLIVAALVSALGLLENSTVILVASMLISPLMGPVMAATFGTMIRDRQLQTMGLVNECVGLLLCLLIGFVTGVGVSLLDRPYPTGEMIDGGLLRSLWVNVLIAVLSGMGIAIALLRDNTGSLVGVAISASLLPPAVNAGLLWGMSLVYAMVGPLDEDPDAPPYSTNYSAQPHMEMAVMGGVSLCITFINIVFVYMTGILMLKVKEVAPTSQVHHQRFWQHDVKIARDYNATLYGASAADILRSVVAQDKCGSPDCVVDREGPNDATLPPELARLLKLSSGLSPHFGDNRYLDVCQPHQLTWSPSTLGPQDSSLPDTVRELRGLYRTIQQQTQQQRQQLHVPHATAASRRASFGSSGACWRLGCSDGYRCHPRRRRAASPSATVPAGPAAAAAATAAAGAPLSVCTPPFNNMPCKSLAADPALLAAAALTTPTSSLAAFKTPLGPSSSTYMTVPTTPSLFMTPLDHTPVSREVPILSVNDETAPCSSPASWQGQGQGQADGKAGAHRPTKKRRFIVTKAEDKELLVPRQPRQ